MDDIRFMDKCTFFENYELTFSERKYAPVDYQPNNVYIFVHSKH